MLCILLHFLKKILFLERGKGRRNRGRETSMCERYINRLSLAHSQLGTWPTTQACSLTGNQTGDLLVCRLAHNPRSHTSQGLSYHSFLKRPLERRAKEKGQCRKYQWPITCEKRSGLENSNFSLSLELLKRLVIASWVRTWKHMQCSYISYLGQEKADETVQDQWLLKIP